MREICKESPEGQFLFGSKNNSLVIKHGLMLYIPPTQGKRPERKYQEPARKNVSAALMWARAFHAQYTLKLVTNAYPADKRSTKCRRNVFHF